MLGIHLIPFRSQCCAKMVTYNILILHGTMMRKHLMCSMWSSIRSPSIMSGTRPLCAFLATKVIIFVNIKEVQLMFLCETCILKYIRRWNMEDLYMNKLKHIWEKNKKIHQVKKESECFWKPTNFSRALNLFLIVKI